MPIGQEKWREEDVEGQHEKADRLVDDNRPNQVADTCTDDTTSTSRSQSLCDLRSLLSHVDIIEPEGEDVLVAALASVDHTTVVSFFNQHAFNLAYSDAEFRAILQDADFLLRDGVGVELALTLLGVRVGKNMNGTDLIPRILVASKGKSVAIIGTQEPWLGKAVLALREAGVSITVAVDGFQREETYMSAVAFHDPDIIILGMGMPRQEKLAATLAKVPGRPRLIVNGGAILDFYAERFKRAPQWVRHHRLEWLFRLLQEPRRLNDRYVWGGAQFLLRILRLVTAHKFNRMPAKTAWFSAQMADKKRA